MNGLFWLNNFNGSNNIHSQCLSLQNLGGKRIQCMITLFLILTTHCCANAESVYVYSSFPMADFSEYLSGQYGCVINFEMPIPLNDSGGPNASHYSNQPQEISFQFENSAYSDTSIGGSPSFLMQELESHLKTTTNIFDKGFPYQIDKISDCVYTIRPFIEKHIENPDVSPLDARVNIHSSQPLEILNEIDDQLNKQMQSTMFIDYKSAAYVCELLTYAGPKEDVKVRDILNEMTLSRFENISWALSFDSNKKRFVSGELSHPPSVDPIRWELYYISPARDNFSDVLWVLRLEHFKIIREPANYFFIRDTRPFLTGLQSMQKVLNLSYGCEEPRCHERCELSGTFPAGGFLKFKYAPNSNITEIVSKFNESYSIPGEDTPRYDIKIINGRFVFFPLWVNSSTCASVSPAEPVTTQPITLEEKANTLDELFSSFCSQFNEYFTQNGKPEIVRLGNIPQGVPVDKAVLSTYLNGDTRSPHPAFEVISAVIDASNFDASWQFYFDYLSQTYVLEIMTSDNEYTSILDMDTIRVDDILKRESDSFEQGPNWREIKRLEVQRREEYENQQLMQQMESFNDNQ